MEPDQVYSWYREMCILSSAVNFAAGDAHQEDRAGTCLSHIMPDAWCRPGNMSHGIPDPGRYYREKKQDREIPEYFFPDHDPHRPVMETTNGHPRHTDHLIAERYYPGRWIRSGSKVVMKGIGISPEISSLEERYEHLERFQGSLRIFKAAETIVQ